MISAEKFVVRGSVAVLLQDDFSKQWFLLDKTTAFIKETGRLSFENPSKFQVFTDVQSSPVTIRVENRNYLTEEVQVRLPDLDPRLPLVTVVMKPGYLYPFPPGSTLIRGRVTDASGRPLAGASLSVVGKALATKSQADGRFVLYFGPLKEEEIVLQNKERLIKVAGDTKIQVKVEHPAHRSKTVAIDALREGETKLLSTIALETL